MLYKSIYIHGTILYFIILQCISFWEVFLLFFFFQRNISFDNDNVMIKYFKQNNLISFLNTCDLQLFHAKAAVIIFQDPWFALSGISHLFLDRETPVVMGGVSTTHRFQSFYPRTDKSCSLLNMRKATWKRNNLQSFLYPLWILTPAGKSRQIQICWLRYWILPDQWS